MRYKLSIAYSAYQLFLSGIMLARSYLQTRRTTMTKEKFLTVRWNNLLTLMLGVPSLIFGIVVLSTSALSDFWGFIGMFILGALY